MNNDKYTPVYIEERKEHYRALDKNKDRYEIKEALRAIHTVPNWFKKPEATIRCEVLNDLYNEWLCPDFPLPSRLMYRLIAAEARAKAAYYEALVAYTDDSTVANWENVKKTNIHRNWQEADLIAAQDGEYQNVSLRNMS